MNAFLRLTLALSLTALAAACSRETEPNPDYQSSSGNGGTTGGVGGDGATDGGDAGGEGGMSGGSGGITGGNGGTGGDSSTTDCDDNTDCSATTPQCSPAGTCISCTSNDACEDRGPLAFCQTKLGDNRGQCVACINDADCQGNDDGDFCLDNACVPCKADTDCTDLTKPECSADGQCTGCTSNDACEDRNGTEVCVTAAGPKRGSCAQCTAHSQCDNPTPQCSDNVCEPCSNNDACKDRNAATICDTSDDETFGGTCVECTATSYASCGTGAGDTAFVCDALDRTCSDKLQGSAQPCSPCIADAHCRTGTACMQTRFGATDTGAYCLWRETAAGAGAPNGDCLNTRTFVSTEDEWISLEGDSIEVCKPRTTTCQGLNDFSSKSCSGTNAEGHAQCGAPNVDDAYCAPFGMSQHRCTVPCASFDDCKNTRPADDNECQTQMIGEESFDTCVFE